MIIFFVRHGETDLNREERLQGQIDCPLNETGIAQANHLRDALTKDGISFDCIISSPLVRAVQTAAIATGFPEERILKDDRLMEINFGPYEGLPFTELKEDMFAFFHDPEHISAPEGVESIQALMERTGAFLRALEHVEAQTVLAVTHGVALRAFLGHLQGDGTEAVWGMPIDNCEIFKVEYLHGQWKLLR